MKIERETYEGEIKYGDWEDQDKLYIDDDRIDTILYEYKGKNVRITIEVIND